MQTTDMADHFNNFSPEKVNTVELLVEEEEDTPRIVRARKSLEENLIKDDEMIIKQAYNDADESNAHLSNDEDEVNAGSSILLQKYTQ